MSLLLDALKRAEAENKNQEDSAAQPGKTPPDTPLQAEHPTSAEHSTEASIPLSLDAATLTPPPAAQAPAEPESEPPFQPAAANDLRKLAQAVARHRRKNLYLIVAGATSVLIILAGWFIYDWQSQLGPNADYPALNMPHGGRTVNGTRSPAAADGNAADTLGAEGNITKKVDSAVGDSPSPEPDQIQQNTTAQIETEAVNGSPADNRAGQSNPTAADNTSPAEPVAQNSAVDSKKPRGPGLDQKTETGNTARLKPSTANNAGRHPKKASAPAHPAPTANVSRHDTKPSAAAGTPRRTTASNRHASPGAPARFHSSAPTVFQRLTAAYRSYQAGQYRKARQDYLQALHQQPQNRDALLGLAAVALRLNENESAQRYYAQLLQHNPIDPQAKAGMQHSLTRVDPAASASRIKNLIREHGEAAYLYFYLGTAYAMQQRWADAKEAFVYAYRLEPGNAEYAYNLAVSYDHLGRFRQALQHYEQTRRLPRPSGLPLSHIDRRIANLKHHMDQQP